MSTSRDKSTSKIKTTVIRISVPVDCNCHRGASVRIHSFPLTAETNPSSVTARLNVVSLKYLSVKTYRPIFRIFTFVTFDLGGRIRSCSAHVCSTLYRPLARFEPTTIGKPQYLHNVSDAGPYCAFTSLDPGRLGNAPPNEARNHTTSSCGDLRGSQRF